MQDLPKVEKQPKWEGPPKPQDNKWDDVINEAVERGREVPEITWAQPGVDAAIEVGPWTTVQAWTAGLISQQGRAADEHSGAGCRGQWVCAVAGQAGPD